MSSTYPVWIVVALWIVGHITLDRATARVSGDRLLRAILGASFALRVGLAVVFYLASYWRWPLLRSLQLGRGFWAFALDSRVYHHYGQRFVDAWAKGIELPNPELAVEYFAFVGAVYRLLGAHPLYPIVLNCWFSAMSGLLAFVIGRRLFDHRTGIASAVLVSCWPSTFLWSTQLLKDSLSAFVVLGTLCVLAYSAPKADEPPSAWWSRLAKLALLGATTIVLTRVRAYLGSALSAATAAVLVIALVVAWRTRRWRPVAACALITMIVTVSVLFARSLNMLELVSSRHPERGHRVLAEQFWRAGDSQRTGEELHKIVRCAPQIIQTYLDIGAAALSAGIEDAAIWAYREYLQKQPAPNDRAVAKLLARLQLLQALRGVTDGDRLPLYEQAIAYDPKLTDAYVGYAVCLMNMRHFEHTIPILAKVVPRCRSEQERAVVWALIAQAYEGLGDDYRPQGRAHTLHVLEAYEHALALKPFSNALMAKRASVIASRRVVSYRLITSAERAQSPAIRSEWVDVTAWLMGDMPPALRAYFTLGRRALTITPEAGPGRFGPFAVVSALDEGVYRRAMSLTTLDHVALAVEDEATDDDVMPPETIATAPTGQTAIAAMSSAWTKQGKASKSTAGFDRRGARPVARVPDERRMPDETEPGPSSPSLLGQLDAVVAETAPEALSDRRDAFVLSGGHSLVDPSVKIDSPEQLVKYLPRALAIGLLSPFPWQWFDTRGSTGWMRVLSSVEMLLLYLLFPGLACGLIRIVRSWQPGALYLLGFVLFGIAAVALVVANIGTLFRLRLQFLLPLTIIACAGDPLRFYQRMWQAIRGVRAQLVAIRSPESSG